MGHDGFVRERVYVRVSERERGARLTEVGGEKGERESERGRRRESFPSKFVD